jgi:hypothetical protein
MAADKMKEILKHFPDLEDDWKEMEEKLKAEPSEREMLSLKYREMLEREKLKENLPEPEFTKAKMAESDSKVMKANEMSKRIYLIDYNDAMVTPLEGDTIYVREDAFIEKACKFIKDNGNFYIDIVNGQLVLKQSIVKDFKKYMKEE